MPRQIALLRGINVGSHNRVGMPALRELLEGHGYGDVRTLLQSGNVVFTSRLSPARVERDMATQIADGLGVDIKVMVRTRDEVAAVLAHDPLGHVADDPKRYQVSFLSEAPDPGIVRELADLDLAPEQFVFSGRELYAWYANGVQQSRLGKVLTDKRLGVAATARNWNTITKLVALADE
jgi:uncharacterized protein (DUF1697 family)